MPTDRICPECGAGIPPGSTDGLCTQCLFSLGLDAPETPAPSLAPPDLAPLLAKAAPAVGVKFHYFGDYELLDEIARGGMGVVFRARQISLNRTVALKLITAGHLATQDAVKRFHLEAEAAARLDHPNIVPIYEIGEHEGHHYFAMKLVAGGSLAQRITRSSRREEAQTSKFSTLNFQPSTTKPEPPHVGSYPTTDAALLVAKVARAVHYAHQRGILHRDLKPGNILLDERGEPHVTDFGLAKLMEDDSSLTHSGMVMGTPSYMSPEQAVGKSAELTTASDLWSLGAILYELLTGQPPFRGATPMETLRQVTDNEPKRPGALKPPVGRDLETICLKCLEKDPIRRYASAAALADDLEHWLRHEPIVARRTSVFERVVKWAQRQPVLAAALLLLKIVLVSGLAGILWHWRQAVVARQAEAAQHHRALRAEADALSRLNEAKLNFVRANRLTVRPGQRFDSLAEVAQAAIHTNSLALRNEAIACLVLPDARLLKQWTKTPSWRSFLFDASHRCYATNDGRGNLMIHDAETDAMIHQIPGQGGQDIIHVAVFSPDDRLVATIDAKGQGWLWDRIAKTPRSIDLPAEATLLGFTPDSQALVVKYSDGWLYFFNTVSGTEENWFAAPRGLRGIQFNATGDQLLMMLGNQIITGRTSDGENLRTITAPKEASDGFRKAVWHPDGRRIAAAWLNYIGLWDVETGRQHSVLKGHEGTVVGLAFTHTGEHLISTSWDGTTRFWDAETGREVLILPESGNALSVSRDGRRLSFQTWDGGQVKLYELADLTAGQRLTLPPQTRAKGHFTCYPVLSPEGGLVLARDEDGIYVFHPPNPAPVALVPIAGEHSVCLAPDGKMLFTGGAEGAQAWPVKWSADRSELHLGPPEVLSPTRGGMIDGVFLSRDAQWLVTRGQNGVMAFQPESPSEVVHFDRQILSGNYPESISPDARWICIIPSSHSRIQIWNGRTGKILTNVPAVVVYQCAFSPDGQWLACSQKDSTMILDTKTWRVARRIAYPSDFANHGLAFSPDGRILATFTSDWKVRLLSFETGNELAAFPSGRMPTSVSFNSAGDQLAVAHEAGYVQLWDLRRVREQLSSLHLDWEMPAYSLEPPARSVRPLRGIVHTGVTSISAWEKPIVRKQFVPTPNQVAETRRSIPARPANLSPALIDLSNHYNGSLHKVWGHNPGNDLAALLPGVHRLGGIDYDVRGVIQVRPHHNPGLPKEVTGIRIDQKCTRLHLLHMTGYLVKKGTKVGAYIVHFKTGQRHEKPIVFGYDLDNWWFRAGGPPTEAKVVWTGSNAEAERYGERIRLFHTIWENPWPDLEVASLDMVSTLTYCNPCLLAITAE